MKNKSREKTNGCLDVPMVQTEYIKNNNKLTDNDKINIYIDYLFNKDKLTRDNILNKYNISKVTFYKIVKDAKTKELANDYITKQRQAFTKKTNVIITKALDKINNELDTNSNIDIQRLTILLGTIYDKQALETGNATSNNNININLKIEK